MNLPVRHDEGFEQELKRQTLISERRRAVVLVWILRVILALLGIYPGALGLRNDELPGRGYTLVTLGVQLPLPSPLNQKRVAEEYATASMSIVMATMARSVPQFGLLMM